MASRWSLGNIWLHCVRSASSILRSYPLLWILSTWTWLDICRLRSSIWLPPLFTAGHIRYVPSGVAFFLPSWVWVVSIYLCLGSMGSVICLIHLFCRLELACSEMWWVHLPLYLLWHHILWRWTCCHRQMSCPHSLVRLVILWMCLPLLISWRVFVMVVMLHTYRCRRRHWLCLLSCLILSISVGLILLCLVH